jgi:hypothetical protein
MPLMAASTRARRALLATSLLAALSCGTTLPPRFVIEHDLGEFAYRRYQKSLEIELPIEGNDATGHTAAYLRRDAHQVTVVSAYVTTYAHAPGLVAEARRSLRSLGGYTLQPAEQAGTYVWIMQGDVPEHWCLWVSGRYLVKIGAARAIDFPDSIVEAYAKLYPSDLDEHGNALADATSAGEAKAEATESTEPSVPAGLRENAPR